MIVSIATLSITTFQLTHSRGVRLRINSRNPTSGISTHALTWSATESSAIRWRNRTDFNSRTHVECDKDASEMWDHNRISTHALTWSATTRVTFLCLLIQFQLTHSRGVRLDFAHTHVWQIHFNSRTHVECDLRQSVPAAAEGNFNSRTHVECDY